MLLKEEIEVGADFAITQVFFAAESYGSLVERARGSGVSLPLIPGIMPVTSLSRLIALCSLAGLEVPRGLAYRLETASDGAERHRIGVEFGAEHRQDALTDGELTDSLRKEVREVIEFQESLGLDVLVHGEAKRSDMVQYFAENFDGFAPTDYGWVQSYGSRCTSPSILWGDVKRQGEGLRGEAFTVPWVSYAQSFTDKPVKGMLTGPVTILAWSFVRDDQPLVQTATQVALALADEIADLEQADIRIIQVDEPALRELLPLRAKDQAAYLDWSVASFRLATSQVEDGTQIHTHLCYSEFDEIFDAIDGLNADVTSIEAARSHLELLDDVPADFVRGIGPGVWDIHSPRVPAADEVEQLLGVALGLCPPGSCGLTRTAVSRPGATPKPKNRSGHWSRQPNGFEPSWQK